MIELRLVYFKVSALLDIHNRCAPFITGRSVKQLTWKLVLPLTIISFTMFTKWWHVDIDDYREILKGFPLPFVCPGWHTSLSLQIFVMELIVDILVYFSFWFFIVMTAAKTIKSFSVPKPLTIFLLAISGLFTIVLTLLAINPDNIYTTTRPFDIKIMETGYRFMGQEEIRTDYNKYPDTVNVIPETLKPTF